MVSIPASQLVPWLEGGILSRLLSKLLTHNVNIYLDIYGYSSREIAKHCLEAHERYYRCSRDVDEGEKKPKLALIHIYPPPNLDARKSLLTRPLLVAKGYQQWQNIKQRE